MTLHLPRHLSPREPDYAGIMDSRFRDEFPARQDSLVTRESELVYVELRDPINKFDFDTDYSTTLPYPRIEYHDADYAFRELHPRTKMRVLRNFTTSKSVLRGERDVP